MQKKHNNMKVDPGSVTKQKLRAKVQSDLGLTCPNFVKQFSVGKVKKSIYSRKNLSVCIHFIPNIWNISSNFYLFDGFAQERSTLTELFRDISEMIWILLKFCHWIVAWLLQAIDP